MSRRIFKPPQPPIIHRRGGGGQASGNEPWKMWGTTTSLDLPPTALAIVTVSQQLGRIDYKRPETWSFFFGAQIISGTPCVAVVQVSARINLLFGVGRAVMDTTTAGTPGLVQEAFAFFQWQVGPSGLPMPQSVDHANKYTTSVRTAPLFRNDDTTREKIDWIPAQSISVKADVEMITADPAASCRVRLTSFLAPRTHLRPDWYQGQFNGEELGGT